MRAAILLMLTIAFTILSGPASCRTGNSSRRDAKDARTASQPTEDANAPTEGDPFAAIPRVKVEELVRALEEGRAVVVDIRAAEAYQEEHIKGAVSIPLEEIRERGARELPTDKLIVTYCA
ncbi:MAG: rhodanese-like domain-containing protein [Pyrinomonadaceae bacterium]|nr:rhodanese-like domain-containing protein [Pyrinomonadaceae bacterium]